jgi:8-oxo-dGTP pyrophosphatase MutT (NUDIX family)
MLGAGMVIIQPATQKIVVLYDTQHKYWFLPKGRKDVGESLEQAALREAYEESGFRAEFMPLHTRTRAPSSPSANPVSLNTEPIFASTMAWGPRHQDGGGEYLTFYYVGQIPEGAIHETGTGMPDEQNYTSHLLSIEEALSCLRGTGLDIVVQYAWQLWQHTLQIEEVFGKTPQDPANAIPKSATDTTEHPAGNGSA